MNARQPREGPARHAPDEAGPAIRDATAIAQAAEADEAAARAARERFREAPIAPLEADETVAHQLRPGERIFAVRPTALVERQPSPGEGEIPAGGTLFLTSERLLHVSSRTSSVDLHAIRETHLIGERVAVLLGGDEVLLLDVDRPRLLRVEIAAAIAAQKEVGAPDVGAAANVETAAEADSPAPEPRQAAAEAF